LTVQGHIHFKLLEVNPKEHHSTDEQAIPSKSKQTTSDEKTNEVGKKCSEELMYQVLYMIMKFIKGRALLLKMT
jgi:hypothetical protein